MKETGSSNERNGGLADLIQQGPCPKYTLRALVIDQFKDIQQARALLWSWAAIADALRLSGRGRELSATFSRVEKQVAKGKLKLPIRQQTKNKETSADSNPNQNEALKKFSGNL